MSVVQLPGVRSDYTFRKQAGIADPAFTYPASAGARAGQIGNLMGASGVRFLGEFWTFDSKANLFPPVMPGTPIVPTAVSQAQADAAFALGWNACLDAMAKLRK